MVMPKPLFLLLSCAAFIFIFSEQVEGSLRKFKDKDKEGEELLLLKRVSDFRSTLVLFDSFVILASCELCASIYSIPVGRGQFGLFLNHDSVLFHVLRLTSSFSKITAIYKKIRNVVK